MRQPAYSFRALNSKRNSIGGLFLEKIVKCTAGAGRTDRGTSRIVSLSFDGGSGYKIRALVPNILLRNAHRNRLRALKLRTRIKVPAILAGAKIRAAFGTLAALADLHGIG